MRIKEIVVGTDGTPPGGAAVEWASREAARRRARLRIVHVYDAGPADGTGTACGSADPDRCLAQAVVSDAARGAQVISPGLNVLAEAVPGEAVPCLLDASTYADLLVVGSPHRTGLIGLVSGTAGRQLITQATCPVVVVHGRGETTGPVVAGIDVTETAETVLATAFAAAADRGVELVVAHTYLPVAPLWGVDLPASPVAGPDEDAIEHAHVEDLIARWRGKFPQVPVRVVVRPGGPAPVLADLSRGARLVVVGNRGHGVLAAAVLGSTGAYLIRHAKCPVWIDRPPVPEGTIGPDAHARPAAGWR